VQNDVGLFLTKFLPVTWFKICNSVEYISHEYQRMARGNQSLTAKQCGRTNNKDDYKIRSTGVWGALRYKPEGRGFDS
jgi:hypothetical protein